MSKVSTFPPDPHARIRKPPAPSVSISHEIIDTISDPIAVAVYAYVSRCNGYPTPQEVCRKFSVTRKRLYKAIKALDSAGFIDGSPDE